MIRLFLAPEKLVSQRIMITGDQARHLALVLRAQPGDAVTLLDGSGYKYDCTLLTVQKREVRAEVIRKSPYSAESPVNIILAQGMPKAEKMDIIIQKSTELGVSKIIPVLTERSQVRHTDKVERWRKIALSASQQSGRERIPEIEEPVTFKTFFKKNEFYHPPLHPLPSREGTSVPTSHLCSRDSLIPSPLAGEPACPVGRGKGEGQTGIIFSESEKNQTLMKVLKNFKAPATITLLIGPEGGFAETETIMAVEKGCIATSLGPRILRTETVALSAISIIQYELGDMG